MTATCPCQKHTEKATKTDKDTLEQHYLNGLQEFSASFAEGTIWKSVESQACCITAALLRWKISIASSIQASNFHNRLEISSFLEDYSYG